MLSDYDKLLVTGRNPIREKQGQVRKPVGRDLIVKMGAKRILVADTGEEFRRSFIETVAASLTSRFWERRETGRNWSKW